MLEALLDAYGASEDEKKALRDYAKEKRTLEDINLQDLSAGDRRVLLQHARAPDVRRRRATSDGVEAPRGPRRASCASRQTRRRA